MIRRMLHRDPSAWIGLAGTLLTCAVLFTRLTREQGDAIQRILDALLVLLVPGTAAAIRSQAYAPATVVDKVTETASRAGGTVGGVVADVLGDVAKLGGKR